MAETQTKQDEEVREPIVRPEGWTYLKALRMLGDCIINTDTSKASDAEKLDNALCSRSYYGIISKIKNFNLQLPDDETRELLRQTVQVALAVFRGFPSDYIDFLDGQYKYALNLSDSEMISGLRQLLDEYADPKDGWQITQCQCGCGRITDVSNENYRQEQAKEPRHCAVLDLLLTGGSRILH